MTMNWVEPQELKIQFNFGQLSTLVVTWELDTFKQDALFEYEN